MIKATGKAGDGSPLLLLGLSGENVTRLAADEPIFIRSDELVAMGLPRISIAVVYGRTEDDIAAQLKAAGAVPRK